jgi:Tol biopolymer transport system component/DNA-binding winged helix-turn-helix (wHTH) protein
VRRSRGLDVFSTAAVFMDRRPNSHPLRHSGFRLRDFIIRPELNRIEQGTESALVEPRVMDVLVCLAEHAGEVVSRDQMLDELWGDAVVVEHVLTRAVSELRRLLKDDPETPLFIETIRKRGYRLVAPVLPLPGRPADQTDQPAPFEPASLPEPHSVPPRAAGRAFWRVVLPLLLLLAAALFWLVGQHRSISRRPVVLEALPFTTYVGDETAAAFSPEGTRIAFSWTGSRRDNADIYVKQRGAEVPLRLTTDPAYDTDPAWSPDGATVAFVRQAGADTGIWTVPAIGGAERRICRAPSRIQGIDWSVDGRRILFSGRDSAGAPARLRALELETLELSDLSRPPLQHEDICPRISPDGKLVAFIRQNPVGFKQICLMPSTGGKARSLTGEQLPLYGLAWRTNGKDIVFTSASAGPASLWLLSVARGSITPLIVRDEWIGSPSCPRRGAGLVYETWSCRSDIVEVSLDPERQTWGDPHPLIESTRWNGYPRISPDGRRIAFASGRSGHSEMWMCDRDGGRPVQLTALEGLSIGSGCSWSADGGSIAYSTSPEGYSAVYVQSVAGGRARRLSFEHGHEQVCDWSHDGAWIYFASDREDGWQIWKMRPDGRDRTRLTRDGGLEGRESADGRWLYFIKPEGGGVWRTSVQGGASVKFSEEPARPQRANWTVYRGGVYYFGTGERGRFLARYDLELGRVQNLGSVPGIPGSGLEVSADGGHILYSLADEMASDLVLAAAFR